MCVHSLWVLIIGAIKKKPLNLKRLNLNIWLSLGGMVRSILDFSARSHMIYHGLDPWVILKKTQGAYAWMPEILRSWRGRRGRSYHWALGRSYCLGFDWPSWFIKTNMDIPHSLTWEPKLSILFFLKINPSCFSLKASAMRMLSGFGYAAWRIS